MILNIKAVAEKAGVSITTVSRVLNHPESVSEKTRQQVLSVMEAMNYTPNWFARNIQSNKTDIIGLILPDIQDTANMQIAKGIEEVAHQKNCDMMLFDTEYNVKNEWECIEKMQGRQADGLILMSSLLSKQQLDTLREKKMPYVLVGKTKSTSDDNIVYTDYESASQEAVSYLIKLGHKNIAVLTGKNPEVENSEKLKGYRNALREAGIPYCPELVAEGLNNIEGGFAATGKLLDEKKKMTAIFATSDAMALGAMEKLKQMDMKVPEDVAVIGYDDLEVGAVVEPKLTTVTRPMYRMGLMAARLLFDIIEDDGEINETQQVVLRSKLKIRKSCGNKDRLIEIW